MSSARGVERGKWRANGSVEKLRFQLWKCLELCKPWTYASLGLMQSTLIRWDREEFGSVKGELRQLRKRLEFIRSRTIRNGPAPEERRIMARLAELLAREEAMEKQRSRVQWLKEGDRNTGFFQAKAKQRARTNKITALCRADGSLCEDVRSRKS